MNGLYYIWDTCFIALAERGAAAASHIISTSYLCPKLDYDENAY